MQRIVVVGGGAGGLELVTRLGDRWGARTHTPRAEVILIDRYPTHVWKPLLHEVAAGSMDPFTHQLEYAAQARWHGFEFQQGELVGLDRTRKIVAVGELRDEDGTLLLPAREIAYDTLVLAIGSTTHFFGVPGADQYAIALDTVSQAERFRRRLVSLCMRARHWHATVGSAAGTVTAGPAVAQTDAEGRATVGSASASTVAADSDVAQSDAATATTGSATTQSEAVGSAAPSAVAVEGSAVAHGEVRVAIVGGGATGVELSAELRNTAQVLAAYGLHDIDPRHDLSITLVEAGPRLLPALSPRLSEETRKLLTKLGVSVMIDARVEAVDAQGLKLADGTRVDADLVVWAAGIKASPVLARLDGLATNRLGQLCVTQTLQTETDESIFALGDCASCAWGDDRRVPPRAQAAHQQASFVFAALLQRAEGKPLGTFEYRDFGSLVSLGRFSAVGSLMGGLIGGSMFVEGLFARFMYTSLYRLHIAALHGYPRMVLDTVAHWLRRSTMPRVKLH